MLTRGLKITSFFQGSILATERLDGHWPCQNLEALSGCRAERLPSRQPSDCALLREAMETGYSGSKLLLQCLEAFLDTGGLREFSNIIPGEKALKITKSLHILHNQ